MKNFRTFFCCSIIAGITLIAFLPSLNNGFTTWDDDLYVVNNPDIKGFTPHHLARIFSSSYVSNYQPLPMLTYMAEYRFFRLNPMVYHSTNLILHIINALLVFLLIYGLSGHHITSLLVGLLFAVHPLRVESVAWIAERKDVLSGFFYFLSLIFHVRYIKGKGRRFYWFCMSSLVLSLLSKPMAVSQPFVLLCIDYLLAIKLGRKNILDKVPFIVIAAIFAAGALLTQKTALPGSGYDALSTIQGICAPFYGIVFYLVKSAFPVHLCAFYPFPADIPLRLLASPFPVIGIASAVWYFRGSSRTLVFGSLFFLVTALPVLQIVHVGNAIVAERYTYIPMLGIYFIVAVFFRYLLKVRFADNSTVKSILAAGVGIYVAVFCCLTYGRCGVWNNSLSLWNDVIAHFPVALSYTVRGTVYSSQGDYDRAIEDYMQAIRLDPKYAEAYNDRGVAYRGKGDYDRAVEDYTEALRLNPAFADAYYNRGEVYKDKGDNDRAIEDYTRAIQLDPKSAKAYNNRGVAYCDKGDYDRAIEDYTRAIRFNPEYAPSYGNRGVAYCDKGDYDRAIEDYTRAIQLDPEYAPSYCNRGVAYCDKGDYDRAIEDYTRAIQLDPKYAQAYNIRGVAYCKRGDYDRAVEDITQAIRLNPRKMDAYYNRGLVYKARGDAGSARVDFKKACEMGFGPACKLIRNN